MRRILPLLTLAILPAVVAAPIPPGAARPRFGDNGLLTRAELEKLKFDSRPLKPGERGGDLKQLEKEPADERKPAKPRPENPYDLAVHMPWRLFREGESIPAYCVLRNNRGYTRSFDARLTLFGPEPTIWNSCSIDVRDTKTGKPVYIIERSGWSCGGGGLVDVPADGFYCVKGDLGRIAGGRPLPPGEYEVDWRCGSLRSAPVTFIVGKADGKIAPAAKRPWFHFYRITSALEDEDEDTTVRKGDSRLEYIQAEEMASALAVGGDVLVPDIHTIPVADNLLEARLEWKPYRDADRLAVTLRAVAPHKQVSFDEKPYLYLQMEVPGGEMLMAKARDEQLEKLAEAVMGTPLTLEARFPAGWRDRVDASGSVRIAVLVSGKKIKLPRGGRAIEKRLEAVSKPNSAAPPLWTGVLRTDYVELRLPPRLPVKQQP